MNMKNLIFIFVIFFLIYHELTANDLKLNEQQKILLLFSEFESSIREQNYVVLQSVFSDNIYIQKEKFNKSAIVSKIQSFFKNRKNINTTSKKYGRIVAGDAMNEFNELNSSCDFQLYVKSITINGNEAYVNTQFQLFGEIVVGSIEKNMMLKVNLKKFDDKWLIVESTNIDEFFNISIQKNSENKNEY